MKGTLVIGSLPRIVAPVARNLHARGIPAHGACIGPAGRKIRSRALRSFTYLSSEDHDPRKFFEELRQTIVTHDIDTVIPCADDVLLALMHHDEALRKLVHYCGPAPEACRKILEKRETLAIASSLGVPVPGEYHIPDVLALQAMRESIRFPVVAKPRNKHVETTTDIKSEILGSFEELSARFDRYPAFGSWFLIQDFLPGFGVGIEILMDRGNPVAAFQHRRVREYPVRGGVSVAAVSEPPDRAMVAHAVRLLRALEWQGVAMVEFRKDGASGRCGLMEVNGRFWGSVALSLACGMEFPWYVWQLAHGQQPLPPALYPAGTRFRWLAGDLRRLYETLTWSGGLRAAAQFLSEFPSAAKDPTWSWRDPVPAVEEMTRALASVGLAAGGAIARRLVPGPAYRRAKALRRAGVSRTASYFRCRFMSRPGTSVTSSEPVHSVVFICHGNIIRSPMAEAVFRDSGSGIRVQSAGTAAIPGRDVDARAAQVARESGLLLDGHTARRISAETVATSDLLVVMDYLNYIALVKTFPQALGKTMLLGGSVPGAPEIDDPYEGTLDDVRATFRMVRLYTRALLARLDELPGTG